MCTAFHWKVRNTPQSYGASPAIWDHTVLPATRHRWTHPALTPAIQAGTWFTYPGGMEGWVDLGVGYIPRRFTCPHTVTHQGSNHLIATRPGVEPTTSRSQVQRPNRYTTKPTVNTAKAFVIFTRDSCTGRYCWERVLAMGILSVCSVCHDPVPIQGQVR